MVKRVIARRTFQTIALATLALAAVAVYRLGPFVIPSFQSLDPDRPTLMATLAVALTALAVVLVWAVLLLPLRARSDMVPLGRELADIRARGGFGRVLEEEGRKLELLARGDDAGRARYHGRMAAGGLLVTAIAALVVWLLWEEGSLFLEAIVVVVVSPLLTLYHAARFGHFAARSRGSDRGPG